MKCQNCKKGELRENISFRGFFIKEKVYTYFCTFCDFQKEKVLKSSLAEFQSYMQKPRVDSQVELSFKADNKSK